MNPESHHINNDLLVKYLLGETTPQEQALVEDWINAHPGNQKEYEDFKFIWEESLRLASTNTIDENAAWLRFRKKLHPAEETYTKTKKEKSVSWLRIAAMLVLLIGMAALSYTLFQKKSVRQAALHATQKVVTDTLPDGSVVTLNKQSDLFYPEQFKDKNRTVSLHGEAFFKVTPNPKKPFIIKVNDITVMVVGTSFNIRSNNGNTEVIVETGIVQVIKNKTAVQLKPKERIVVQQQDSVLKKEPVKDQLYNYYRTKEFVCDNTPLWKLISVLNEAYGSHIIIDRPALRNLPLTTTFHDEPLDHILQIISETLAIKVVKTGNGILLQ